MSAPSARRRDGDHDGFDALAVGFALHALEPEDEAVFALHLPGCDRCAATVADTTGVMAAMATDLPGAEPSPELQRRLMDAVGSTEQVHRPRPASPPPSPPTSPPGTGSGTGSGTGRERDPWDPDALRDLLAPAALGGPAGGAGGSGARAWRRVLPVALAAAAVATILALGVWNVTLGQSRDEAQETVAAQGAVIEALLEPGPATVAPLRDGGGPQLATVVAREGEVHVVTEGLPVNDDARNVYVLWGIDGDTPVGLGTFDVVDAGPGLHTVGSSATGSVGFPEYAISLEPGRQAPPAPTSTQIVARGEVTS